MTLREVIDGVVQDWWGFPDSRPTTQVRSGVSGLANMLELRVRNWMDEKNHHLDQIIALALAGTHPCLRMSSKSIIEGAKAPKNEWNLQLSPEAGHLIDFDGTLEDILEEACEKYLPKKEATT